MTIAAAPQSPLAAIAGPSGPALRVDRSSAAAGVPGTGLGSFARQFDAERGRWAEAAEAGAAVDRNADATLAPATRSTGPASSSPGGAGPSASPSTAAPDPAGMADAAGSRGRGPATEDPTPAPLRSPGTTGGSTASTARAGGTLGADGRRQAAARQAAVRDALPRPSDPSDLEPSTVALGRAVARDATRPMASDGDAGAAQGANPGVLAAAEPVRDGLGSPSAATPAPSPASTAKVPHHPAPAIGRSEALLRQGRTATGAAPGTPSAPAPSDARLGAAQTRPTGQDARSSLDRVAAPSMPRIGKGADAASPMARAGDDSRAVMLPSGAGTMAAPVTASTTHPTPSHETRTKLVVADPAITAARTTLPVAASAAGTSTALPSGVEAPVGEGSATPVAGARSGPDPGGPPRPPGAERLAPSPSALREGVGRAAGAASGRTDPVDPRTTPGDTRVAMVSSTASPTASAERRTDGPPSPMAADPRAGLPSSVAVPAVGTVNAAPGPAAAQAASAPASLAAASAAGTASERASARTVERADRTERFDRAERASDATALRNDPPRERPAGDDFASALAAAHGLSRIESAVQATYASVADAAPVAITVRDTIDSPGFAPSLASQVSLLARDGVERAEIRLNPAEMGPVSVQILMEGTQARVEFTADLAATRAAIESSLPQLASSLREAGLTLSGGGVFQQPPGDRQAPRQGQEGGGRGRSGPPGARIDGVGGPAGSVGSALGRSGSTLAGDGRIDLYA